MESHSTDTYNSIADVQLRYIRAYSPNACAVLEKLRPFGSKAVFQAAFTVALYKSMLEMMRGVPENFDYYHYVQSCPQVVPLLDQAINCLLEDWLCGNVKLPRKTSPH
jgi:hypothetical protein